MLMDFYWHIMHLWFFVAQFGLPDHLISPMLSRTSSVSFQDFSLTPLKRKYWGDEGGGGGVVSILLVEICLALFIFFILNDISK